MADIEVVIKIPEKAKQAFDRAESNDLKGGYYDHGGVIGNAIKNGIVLPKGHGRLIDADAELEGLRKMKVVDEKDKQSVRFSILNFETAPTIIDAESEE